MSFDDVMLIVSVLLVVGSLGWRLGLMFWRHCMWVRELNSASAQVLRGARENNDAEFKAGLERMTKLHPHFEEGE